MGVKDKPIKKGKLSDIVVERLNAQIRSGELKSGEKLPTERAMAESMGVSRTVIREAIRIMVDNNILELRNGRSYVRQLTFDEIVTNICGSVVPEQLSLLEILEVRTVLELYIVKKAAENITEEKLGELEEIIVLSEFQVNRENGGSPDQITALDGRFHAALYEASGSRILARVLTDFHNYVKMARQTSVASQERARKSIREHRQILRAIRERDGELAEQLANEHIMHVIENLKKQGF